MDDPILAPRGADRHVAVTDVADLKLGITDGDDDDPFGIAGGSPATKLPKRGRRVKRLWPLVGAFLFALVVCSSAFAAMVGSRHQAEAMTDLGDPAWVITQEDDGTADDGTHIRFKGIADSADKVRLSV